MAWVEMDRVNQNHMVGRWVMGWANPEDCRWLGWDPMGRTDQAWEAVEEAVRTERLTDVDVRVRVDEVDDLTQFRRFRLSAGCLSVMADPTEIGNLALGICEGLVQLARLLEGEEQRKAPPVDTQAAEQRELVAA